MYGGLRFVVLSFVSHDSRVIAVSAVTTIPPAHSFLHSFSLSSCHLFSSSVVLPFSDVHSFISLSCLLISFFHISFFLICFGSYVGQWLADKRHGIGREVTADGSVYEGEYRNGTKHGHGRMESPSGDVYEGEFVKGDMNGKSHRIKEFSLYTESWGLLLSRYPRFSCLSALLPLLLGFFFFYVYSGGCLRLCVCIDVDWRD